MHRLDADLALRETGAHQAGLARLVPAVAYLADNTACAAAAVAHQAARAQGRPGLGAAVARGAGAAAGLPRARADALGAGAAQLGCALAARIDGKLAHLVAHEAVAALLLVTAALAGRGGLDAAAPGTAGADAGGTSHAAARRRSARAASRDLAHAALAREPGLALDARVALLADLSQRHGAPARGTVAEACCPGRAVGRRRGASGTDRDLAHAALAHQPLGADPEVLTSRAAHTGRLVRDAALLGALPVAAQALRALVARARADRPTRQLADVVVAEKVGGTLDLRLVAGRPAAARSERRHRGGACATVPGTLAHRTSDTVGRRARAVGTARDLAQLFLALQACLAHPVRVSLAALAGCHRGHASLLGVGTGTHEAGRAVLRGPSTVLVTLKHTCTGGRRRGKRSGDQGRDGEGEKCLGHHCGNGVYTTADGCGRLL